MARKSKIGKHGSGDEPETRDNAPASVPPAEEKYRVGPGRPPKEHQWQPGKSGNPRGAKRKRRSLIPELNMEGQAARGVPINVCI